MVKNERRHVRPRQQLNDGCGGDIYVFEALDVDSSGDLDRTEGDRLVSILNALGKLGLAPQESAKALNDDS